MAGSHSPFRRLRYVWRKNKDAPATLGIAMAAIAMLFIVGIIVAFNNARLDSMASQQQPAATASAPQPQPETTSTSRTEQPALPTPGNTKP